MKYLMSTYTKGNFKPVSSVPSPYSKLEAFGFNVDDYRDGKKVDKERLLADYNKVRLQNFEINEQEKLKAFQSECFDKYLRKRRVFPWEFESLNIP